MAVRTSVQSGLWSAAGTWDTGVPGDGDTAIVVEGHSVEYDADHTAFVPGVTLTINGELWASETPGKYLLKTSTDLVTLPVASGAILRAGSTSTPYPLGCWFTWVAQRSASGQIFSTSTNGARFELCGAPTANLYVKLSEDFLFSGVGPFTVPIDRDITADPLWNTNSLWPGGFVSVSIATGTSGTYTRRNLSIVSTTPTSITLLTNSAIGSVTMLAGTPLILTQRNVEMNCTSTPYLSGFPSPSKQFHWCRISGLGRIPVDGYSITGAVFSGLTAIGWLPYQSEDVLFDRCVFLASSVSIQNVKRTNCIVMSSWAPLGEQGISYDELVVGMSDVAYLTSSETKIRAHFSSSAMIVAGQPCHNLMLKDCTCENIRSYCFRDVLSGTLINCQAPGLQMAYPYFPLGGSVHGSPVLQSFDHNQVPGAFRAWSRGGVVTSVASPVPHPGRVRSYEHVCTRSTGWTLHQRELTVETGRQLRARVWLRHETGVDVKAWLMAEMSDPLSFDTPAVLAEFDASALADDAWHESILTWTNTSVDPRTITLRLMAQAASGSAWSDFEFAFDRLPGGNLSIF